MDISVTKIFDKPICGDLNTQPASRCCAYPQSALLSDGTIVCFYRVGTEKHSWDGSVEVALSHDSGDNWSQPITVFDGPASEPVQSVICGGVCETSDRRLLVVFVAVDASRPELCLFSEEGQRLSHSVYCARSDDGGLTWSAPHQVDVRSLMNAGPTCKPHALPNGQVFVPLETRIPSGVVGTAATFTVDGLRFAEPIICAGDHTGHVNYCDARFAVMGDGRLLMLLWTFLQESERTVDVHCCWSHDNGRSWSAPVPTGIPGQIAAPVCLPNGDVLIAVNHRTAPEGIHLWLWPDGNPEEALGPVLMWSACDKRLVAEPVYENNTSCVEGVWDALPGFAFGTPDLLSLADGSVIMTYYAVIDGITHIRACRFLVECTTRPAQMTTREAVNVM